jgi:hypothetical protein
MTPEPRCLDCVGGGWYCVEQTFDSMTVAEFDVDEDLLTAAVRIRACC